MKTERQQICVAMATSDPEYERILHSMRPLFHEWSDFYSAWDEVDGPWHEYSYDPTPASERWTSWAVLQWPRIQVRRRTMTFDPDLIAAETVDPETDSQWQPNAQAQQDRMRQLLRELRD